MQVYNIPTGAIGTNTYLVFEEESNKGFLVDPGSYNSGIAAKIKEMGIDIYSLDEKYKGLVYFTSALVGAQNTCMVLSGLWGGYSI